MCVFCGLNTKSYLQAIHIRSHRQASCSTSVWPCMLMLSAILIHPWHSLKDLIHLFLEDVLGTDQAKGKLQETVSCKRTVEGHKQAGVLVEYD